MKQPILLFSVTVHESYDAINDLISSILMSYNNSFIVLHANVLWKDFDKNKINLLNDRVFINHNRFPLHDRMQGKTGIHLSNIDFFNSLSINYDYVILCASNELYIKKIDIAHIVKNQYGSDFLCVSKESPYYKVIPHHDTFYLRDVIGNLLDFISSTNGIFSGRHEGMFFSKELANEMIKIYFSKFGYLTNLCRCDEEIILHTFLYNIASPTYTESLCYFSRKLVTYETVYQFQKNALPTSHDFFIKYDTTAEYKYSIKGIDRFNQNLRNEIKVLIGI